MESHVQIMAGVDEAGRGPLAGPVIAAAVILDENQPIAGLADSKTISEKNREKLAVEIKEKALAWAVGRSDAEEIDKINILQATMCAMQRAVEGLSVTPDLVLVDGNRSPGFKCASEAIVKGDQKVAEISAASIIAKVTRDLEMKELDKVYPQYGFAKHKGYPSKAHMATLLECGPCPEHRQTFGPVKRSLGGG